MTENTIPLSARNREEARRLGLQTYVGPKPCKRDHDPAIRYTKGGQCVTCSNEWNTAVAINDSEGKKQRDRDYYARPKVKARAIKQQQKRRIANPQSRKDQYDKHYAKHPETYGVRNKRYAKKHPEAGRVRQSRRRARNRGANGNHTKEDLAEILDMQKGKCAYCRVKLTRKDVKLAGDHIISLFAGGSHERRNMQMLCTSCNASKQHKDPIDFVRQKFGWLL